MVLHEEVDRRMLTIGGGKLHSRAEGCKQSWGDLLIG